MRHLLRTSFSQQHLIKQKIIAVAPLSNAFSRLRLYSTEAATATNVEPEIIQPISETTENQTPAEQEVSLKPGKKVITFASDWERYVATMPICKRTKVPLRTMGERKMLQQQRMLPTQIMEDYLFDNDHKRLTVGTLYAGLKQQWGAEKFPSKRYVKQILTRMKEDNKVVAKKPAVLATDKKAKKSFFMYLSSSFRKTLGRLRERKAAQAIAAPVATESATSAESVAALGQTPIATSEAKI